MKVSMDHYFSSCKGCPFVKENKDMEIGFGKYTCRLGNFFVSGEGIDPNCGLEEGKIYKNLAKDIH